MIFEECPKCHIIGKRKTFAVYDDGHKYCFYCSHYQPATTRLTALRKADVDSGVIRLPYDASPVLSLTAIEWLAKYELTRMDALYHTLLWSTSHQFLIFPFTVDDRLLAWQARDFKENSKTKWFSQGNLRELFHIVGNFPEREVVLVEDMVSCMKVGKFKNTLCLFGSSPPADVLARLPIFYDKAYIWLDPDAHPKVPLICKKLSMIGMSAVPIFTDGDPKESSLADLNSIFRGDVENV